MAALKAVYRVGICAAAAATVALLVGCGIHTDYFETRAFEVTVDLTAEGQRMQITRTIECEPWRRRKAGLVPYTQWRPKTRSFGRRLPSGAAVMIVTPSFCRSAYRKEGSTSDAPPVSEGHVPYIGWTDDADNPTVVEAYISPEYFEQPYARVVYHGMTARIVSAGSLDRNKPNELDWFENWEDLTGANLAFGLYARVVPPQIWRELPEVVDAVRNTDRPLILSQEITTKLKRKTSLSWGKERARGGLGLRSGPSPDRAYDQNADTEAAANIHPVVKVNNEYQISRKQRGLIAIYRIGSPTQKVTATRDITLEIGQDVLEFPVTWFKERTVYDPQSQIIYQIMAGLPTRYPNITGVKNR